MLHRPMLKIWAALNKEKGFASFRNPVPIRTMIWYFHLADFCIGLLAFHYNREFARSNRVSGYFCWNYFREILSYSQRKFWRMWNLQNRLFHITDETLSKALVNISIGWYNLFGRMFLQMFSLLSRPVPFLMGWPSRSNSLSQSIRIRFWLPLTPSRWSERLRVARAIPMTIRLSATWKSLLTVC